MGALKYDTDFMFISDLDKSVYVPSIVDKAISEVESSDYKSIEFENQDLIIEVQFSKSEGETRIDEVYINTDRLDAQPDLEDCVKDILTSYYDTQFESKRLYSQAKDIKKQQSFAL